jgi:hypothetical protein
METLRVWSPRYPTPLTLDDAVMILSSVGNLFDVLNSTSGGTSCSGSDSIPTIG